MLNSDKEKIINTISNNIIGVSYRHGGEFVKIISDISGVDYNTCFTLLEDIVEEINISYAKELLKHPMINMGNGFVFTANRPFCEKIINKIKD